MTWLLYAQTWNWVIGSPGQWVIRVIFHVRVTGSPGLTRCETRVFPVFEKNSQNAERRPYIWNAEMTKVIVGCLLLDWNHCNELLLLPMIIKNSLAWEYFFTHKSTFGVHHRTGSPGQLGLRVTGFPGHRSLGRWVTKCDPVPSLTTLAA